MSGSGARRPIALFGLAVFAVGCLMVWGCGVDEKQDAELTGMSCYVSILPQAFFVERIGGRHVDVHVLVGPGQSPATFEPTAKQLSLLANSTLYFAVGVPIEERLLPRIRRNFPDVAVVQTQSGIDPRKADAHDPHAWLNPRLTKVMAANIRDALIRADGQHAENYAENCDALLGDLDAIDGEIAAMLAPFAGAPMFVFHPAFGYFADAYGLEQVAIEAGGATPGSRHLAEIIERATDAHIGTIFVQPEFSVSTAEAVADAVGADVIVLDPLSRDYLRNLREMSEKISATMGKRNVR